MKYVIRFASACALVAAVAANAKPILVLTGKGARTKADSALPEGTLTFADLAAAVDFILKP